MADLKNEPMLEVYLFESGKQLDDFERYLIDFEQHESLSIEKINEIFRIMHSLKGSSAMMMFDNLANLTHGLENLFSYFRDENKTVEKNEEIIDVLFECLDFLKDEISKIAINKDTTGNPEKLINKIVLILSKLNKNSKENIVVTGANQSKNYYVGYTKRAIKDTKEFEVKVYFDEFSKMENIRAFSIINNLSDDIYDLSYIPESLDNVDSAEIIKNNGLYMKFKSMLSETEISDIINYSLFIKKVEINNKNTIEQEVNETEPTNSMRNADIDLDIDRIEKKGISKNTNMISVDLNKVDKLIDLIGELVISGMIVVRNLDGKDNEIKKSANIHKKIINELQDLSMSIRMIPVSNIFTKMQRIIRDISKKMNKSIELVFFGENTEIDKNVIDIIADPLMHLVRNAADHGIEENIKQRIENNKSEKAKITLEAKNVGNEVWIIVKDDGKGINKQSVYKKAFDKGLTSKAINELSDNEIYNFLFQPGFSTKENITEFSGRGVGLDVVLKNVRLIGGYIFIDSKENVGTMFTIKIPLTLSIIAGMTVYVGDLKYTIPTNGVRECFKPKESNIVKDSLGNEIILIRGISYSIVRIHEIFDINTSITNFRDGIFILVENQTSKYCIFADRLIGEQQVVVKPLPSYINKDIKGISGCTLLADGGISLILDLESLG